MDLYDAIFQRKSHRQFIMEPLSNDLMKEVDNAIKGFRRLYNGVSVRSRKATSVQGAPAAPHYLIIEGTDSRREYESAGFLFQQLDLWLSARGLGGIWLGLSRSGVKERPTDIITYAFGMVEGSPHRSLEQFDRKPIEDITNIPGSLCVQAAHLAPSGRNLQPWYFEAGYDGILVYKQPPEDPAYTLTDVDMGIALCHFALAAEREQRKFGFARLDLLPPKEGYEPFGIITLSEPADQAGM